MKESQNILKKLSEVEYRLFLLQRAMTDNKIRKKRYFKIDAFII